MSNEGLTDDNLKELIFYLNNVKLIDRLRVLQVDVVILVIWALLMIIASISETFLNISTGSDFTVIVWIISLIFGGVITMFLKEQMYLTFRPKFRFINNVFLLSVSIGVIIAIIFDYILKINEVIFPLFSIIIAIYTYYLLDPYYKLHLDVFKKNFKLFVPIFSLVSGLVNFLGFIYEQLNLENVRTLLGGQAFAAFQSLIFTIFVSTAILITAWYNHKQINYAIENIEITD